jgi:DNA-binding response OmpR family regulator
MTINTPNGSNFTTTPTLNLVGSDLDLSSTQPRQRVLVIDDDPDFITMTKLILVQAGFDVAGALGCNAALEKCSEVNPDLILLDLMMPEIDGFETYKRLAQVTEAPVIVITASGDRSNAVRSLEAGIQDYISKPFYNAEMVARIQAVLRRSKTIQEEAFSIFPDVGLLVKFDSHEVFLHDRFIQLVPREFALLSILAKNAPKPVHYDAITQHMWGEDNSKNRSHLKNIVFSLRQKLEEVPTNPQLLINYRSLGYQLVTKPD